MQSDLLVENTTQENYFLRHLLHPLPLHPLPLLKLAPPQDLPIPQPTLHLHHFPRLLPLSPLLLLLQLLLHTPMFLVTRL